VVFLLCQCSHGFVPVQIKVLQINNLREVMLQDLLFEAAVDGNGVRTRNFIAGKVQMNPDSLKELNTAMQNV
jgi:hypothetical protein